MTELQTDHICGAMLPWSEKLQSYVCSFCGAAYRIDELTGKPVRI